MDNRMKRMKFIIGLLLVSLLTYCQDKVFKETVTFEKGFNFSINGVIQTLPYTGGATSQVEWLSILNKPLSFPPETHSHAYKPLSYIPSWEEILGKPTFFSGSYTDLTDKPSEIELQDAISQLPGIIIPKLTTIQINALTPIEGLEVYDLTLHVKKYYNGTIWKIYITGN
jgi:hypothetical protein